jgi:hypothetical protein
MEPQRHNAYAESEPARFVGSFERFDLYVSTFSSGRRWVRVAWSNGPDDYESYPIEGRLVKFEPVWEVKNSPSAHDLMLIEHYLSLFVPELGIKSRYMERITNET